MQSARARSANKLCTYSQFMFQRADANAMDLCVRTISYSKRKDIEYVTNKRSTYMFRKRTHDLWWANYLLVHMRAPQHRTQNRDRLLQVDVYMYTTYTMRRGENGEHLLCYFTFNTAAECIAASSSSASRVQHCRAINNIFVFSTTMYVRTSHILRQEER